MPKTFYTERDIVDLAARGTTALEVNDDVVLTDLGMPGMGGPGLPKAPAPSGEMPSMPENPPPPEERTHGRH